MTSKFAPNKRKLPCGRLCCSEMGVHTCSACFRVDYCSVECQKADWEVHKAYCSKKMDPRLDAFRDCPKKASAILNYLDTIEEYLSRDAELALRLRVSVHFLLLLVSIQKNLHDVVAETMGNMRHLFRRLQSAFDSSQVAMRSGRVCCRTDDKKSNISTIFSNSYFELYTFITSHGIDITDHRESLQRQFASARESNDGRMVGFAISLSKELEASRDFAKAVEVLEQAYCAYNERYGPENLLLQSVIIFLCRVLGKMGDFDRMLEYIQEVRGNLSFHSTEDSDIMKRFILLYTVSRELFVCVHYLPVDHPHRKVTFEQTVQLAAECTDAHIAYQQSSPFFPALNKGAIIEGGIPDDLDIDCIQLLKLLIKAYKVHVSLFKYGEALDSLKDGTEILRYVNERLKKGLLQPSEEEWDVLIEAIGVYKECAETALPWDEGNERRKLMGAEIARTEGKKLTGSFRSVFSSLLLLNPYTYRKDAA